DRIDHHVALERPPAHEPEVAEALEHRHERDGCGARVDRVAKTCVDASFDRVCDATGELSEHLAPELVEAAVFHLGRDPRVDDGGVALVRVYEATDPRAQLLVAGFTDLDPLELVGE